MSRDNPKHKFVVDALMELGGKRTLKEIEQKIISDFDPDYGGDVQSNLYMYSVNYLKRIHYSQNNKEERLTYPGNEYDKIFKNGNRRGITYELYDYKKHGIWGIREDNNPYNNNAWRVVSPDEIKQEKINDELNQEITNEEIEQEKITNEINQLKNKFKVDANNDYLFQKLIEKTEELMIVKVRVAQAKFRQNLAKIESKCRISGVNQQNLLIASHIKPWSKSEAEEKIDGNNGLFLIPNADYLFDRGYISFTDNGKILYSDIFSDDVYKAFGIVQSVNVGSFNQQQKKYLEYHRSHVFEKIKY